MAKNSALKQMPPESVSSALPTRTILVADPDPEFLAGLPPEEASFPIHGVSSVADFNSVVENPAAPLLAVFLNPGMTEDRGLSLLKNILNHRPATPIFFLQDPDAPPALSPQQMNRLPVHELVPKEHLFHPGKKHGLHAHLNPLRLDLDPKDYRQRELFGVTRADEMYVPLPVDDFLSGAATFLDIYIRLASGHYVKILNEGDRFTHDQLKKYVVKGVANFFAKRVEWKRYLRNCDDLLEELLKNPKASDEEKVQGTLKFGEQTLNYLLSHGLEESEVLHVNRFVTKVETVVKHLQLDRHPALRGFLGDLAHYDHAVGATMVSALLCQALEVDPTISTEVVGLAALLHDVGLQHLPKNLHNEDESTMTPEEVNQYRSHPQVGARILGSVQGVETSVIEIVQQHHVRRDRRGFPSLQGVSRINRLAEIVGVADEFVRLIHKASKDPSLKVLDRMEAELDGFSRPVAKAFRELFLLTLL